MTTENYNYNLPKELIASAPAEPRDSSQLLIYSAKTDEIVFDTFSNIARYVPARTLLVLNDTKVVPARLELTKITGGAVNILFLFNEWDKKGVIKGLPDKGVNIGDSLYFNHRPLLQALSHTDQEFSFKILAPPEEFSKICDTHGRMPLPPYIPVGLNEEEARQKYQTIFAARPASVAAPTASLHFTDRVLQSLAFKGVERATVTLHVGRGTFAPVTDKEKNRGTLHSEPIEIAAETATTVMNAKKEGRMVLSSGTTATRLLESAADSILAGQGYSGETSLFIYPPYSFKIVDAMITNFHLPGTSLIMMVDAFLQFKGARKSWRELYELAVKEKFRFYSFGDAMLIE